MGSRERYARFGKQVEQYTTLTEYEDVAQAHYYAALNAVELHAGRTARLQVHAMASVALDAHRTTLPDILDQAQYQAALTYRQESLARCVHAAVRAPELRRQIWVTLQQTIQRLRMCITPEEVYDLLETPGKVPQGPG